MTEAPTVTTGNEMFLHNMRPLWRHDPQLAIQVDAVHDDDRIPLEPTRSGAWTARMAPPDASPTYLHSRYDPVAEAERLVDAVPVDDKFCFVVCGMGLGYHLAALYRRLRGDRFILCIEPSISLIATALTCVDLADAIAAGRLVILTDDNKTRLHQRLHPFNTLMMLGAHFLHHPPSMRIGGQKQADVLKAVAEFITYTRMTLVTLVANSRITCKNIAMNLVHYVTTPPIDLLHDRFAGHPAVVISAGPSLARNVDQLKDLKGRAVLCAVQTTIKPLLQRGIVPDFLTSLDYHEMSKRFFEGVEGLESVHLVAEPKATWHVLDHYPGPISLLQNDWARQLLGDALGARGGLKAGATVAHLAFYLAVYMGCDPIIFVGQDLAFTGHAYYFPGVEVHRAWRSELNRFNTLEHKEWERIARNRPILRRVQSTDGAELYTDELLFTYLEQFERDIAEVPRCVINATEGGAMIRGTEVMPLRQTAERYCRDPIPPDRFAYRQASTWRDNSRLPAAQAQIDQRLQELDAAIDVCDELLVLLQELDSLTHDPRRFNRRLIRVDELRTKVHQDSRAYRLVNAFTQLAELRRYSADRRIGANETSDAERAKQQIARDIDFVGAVRDGADDLRPILQEAHKRLAEAAGR